RPPATDGPMFRKIAAPVESRPLSGDSAWNAKARCGVAAAAATTALSTTLTTRLVRTRLIARSPLGMSMATDTRQSNNSAAAWQGKPRDSQLHPWHHARRFRGSRRDCTPECEDHDDDAQDDAVPERAALRRVAVDPRRDDHPDAEQQVEPAQSRGGPRRVEVDGREDRDDDADNDAVPSGGRRMQPGIHRGRNDQPDSSKEADTGCGAHLSRMRMRD